MSVFDDGCGVRTEIMIMNHLEKVDQVARREIRDQGRTANQGSNSLRRSGAENRPEQRDVEGDKELYEGKGEG
jgi:hypothetical protein